MALSKVVDEKDTAYLVVSFYDKDGNSVSPVSATYSIYCETNKQEVKEETSIDDLSTSIEITLASADNAIINSYNAYEERRVTVKSTYAGGEKKNESYTYKVLNQSQIT